MSLIVMPGCAIAARAKAVATPRWIRDQPGRRRHSAIARMANTSADRMSGMDGAAVTGRISAQVHPLFNRLLRQDPGCEDHADANAAERRCLPASGRAPALRL